jgi:AbiV family abortive infection protein
MASADPLPDLSKLRLRTAIRACVENGERLLDDALMLEFQTPPASRLALSLIAQEEFAKAFVLFLVREGVVPRNRNILRALNDHACKQLVGMIIEYVQPHWETVEELQAFVRREVELGYRFPPEIASALNILRFEKIGRWESRGWRWDEPPQYDPTAVHVAKGRRDRIKQDALYVRLDREMHLISTPSETPSERVDEEYARGERYRGFARSLLGDAPDPGFNYKKVRDAFELLFARAG